MSLGSRCTEVIIISYMHQPLQDLEVRSIKLNSLVKLPTFPRNRCVSHIVCKQLLHPAETFLPLAAQQQVVHSIQNRPEDSLLLHLYVHPSRPSKYIVMRLLAMVPSDPECANFDTFRVGRFDSIFTDTPIPQPSRVSCS